jgi:hypothetical protein
MEGINMKIEIKNRFNYEIILCGEYESIKDALEKNRASLDGASLYRASLNGASLDGASLDRASLYGASLENTKGVKYPLISISGSRNLFCYYNGYIKIGCNFLLVKDWIKEHENGDQLAKKFGYTDEEIQEYYGYIKMCEQYARGPE